MRQIYRKILPWLIWCLPALALIGGCICYDPADLSKAAMFAGTMLGIWVATFTAYVTSRSSQLQILLGAQRHFFSKKTMPALTKLGPIWSDERRKVAAGTWQLQDNVGVQYLQAIEGDGKLHNYRRKLSGLYESLCALVNEGIVSRRLAVSVFSNLEERAAWLTVIEEFLALKISTSRFTNSNRDQFISSWNKSRRWIRPNYDDIEVGKPHMRTFSRMRLILDATKPSQCDYDHRVLRIHPDNLLVTDTQKPQEPLKINFVNEES